MKHVLLLIFSTFLFQFTSSAQIDCASDKYTNAAFSIVDTIKDISYGMNTNVDSIQQTLLMDIYHSPDDLTANRPVIVLAHGGFFIGGSKEAEDMQYISTEMAKRGFVCISISYRLGIPNTIPDSFQLSQALLRAVQDGGAAVRFLKKDVAENGNTYRIDTNNLFVGGTSAGGFLGLHLAFMNDDSKIPSFVDTTGVGLSGGVYGNSGNPGYSTRVNGVISYAGALGDANWIDKDLPVFSTHGTNDFTVPYGSGLVRFLGLPLINVDGSSAIHTHMDNQGYSNCFKSFERAGHVPHADSQENLDTTIGYTSQFLFDVMCENAQLSCISGLEPTVTPNVQEVNEVKPFRIINSLANEGLRIISLKETLQLTVFDVTGKLLGSYSLNGDFHQPIQQAGLYILRIQNAQGKVWTEKVAVN